MTTPTIAIIGTGNMGQCIIGGLIANSHPSEKLWASDPSTEKLAQVQQKFHIETTADNNEAIHHADIVVFATKPQVLAEAIKASADTIKKSHPLIISIAAGVKETNIQQWVGSHIAIVRGMPNVAGLIACGAT